MSDRQIGRWANARRRHFEAVQAHREAQRELDAAAAEMTTAGSAVAERLQLVDHAQRPVDCDRLKAA